MIQGARQQYPLQAPQYHFKCWWMPQLIHVTHLWAAERDTHADTCTTCIANCCTCGDAQIACMPTHVTFCVSRGLCDAALAAHPTATASKKNRSAYMIVLLAKLPNVYRVAAMTLPANSIHCCHGHPCLHQVSLQLLLLSTFQQEAPPHRHIVFRALHLKTDRGTSRMWVLPHKRQLGRCGCNF